MWHKLEGIPIKSAVTAVLNNRHLYGKEAELERISELEKIRKELDNNTIIENPLNIEISEYVNSAII